MTFLASKWFLLLGLLITVLTVLYVVGKKSVHSEVVVSASAQQVWSVLMDTDHYADWNQVLVPIAGSLNEGEKVTYRFHQDADNTYEIQSRVKKIVTNKLLNQGGGMPGFLAFDHRYELTSTPEGTRITIHEDYRGIAVWFWNPEAVKAAYVRLNQQLKERVLEVYGNE